jgi:hypothetical protein
MSCPRRYQSLEPAARPLDGSGCLWDVVKDQKVRPGTWGDSVGAALIVAKLDEQSPLVEFLDDRADLPACKLPLRKVRQQRHHVQSGRPFVLRFHQSTQQVTNLGALSPVRTIHVVLTTALFPCRLIGTSRRQRVPQGSATTWVASLERAPSSRTFRNHTASLS